jgi:hypothetical protein
MSPIEPPGGGLRGRKNVGVNVRRHAMLHGVLRRTLQVYVEVAYRRSGVVVTLNYHDP